MSKCGTGCDPETCDTIFEMVSQLRENNMPIEEAKLHVAIAMIQCTGLVEDVGVFVDKADEYVDTIAKALAQIDSEPTFEA